MLVRQKRTKCDKLLVCFIVLVNADAWLIGMSFFIVCARFWIVFFSKCIFIEKFAILFQKWVDQKWRESGHLLFNCASFRHHHICMDWNQQEIVIFVSPPWTSSLLDEKFEVCSDVFFEFACTYQISDFVISFDELHQCNITFLPIIVRPSAFFLVSGDQKSFWCLLKIDYSFFKFFCNNNWLLMFHSVFCSSSFWMKILKPIIVHALWGLSASLKCGSGLQRLEKPDFLMMHTSLRPGA